MKLGKVSLVPLQKEDIELVRRWRNAKHIQEYMSYREHITSQMQEKWFESLDKTKNFYYIILFENKKIGLSNIKNIDWEERCGEGGIFIYDVNFQNSVVPYMSSLLITKLAFEELKFNYTYIHVLKSNKRAIRFNKSLGYLLAPNQEDVENQKYTLTKEKYEVTFKQLEKIVLQSI
ncbi:hypothetical protein J53TS2_10040 [Paenibacillus sp. J53TS2]|uniref:GNAT family N-acetyltransferase n=1 Tax=Paenibacillus sp. J53TS2 TaxID=2807197 RepID=UPI001B0EB360|nr:GNAT family N-acetyltransferase [Paenibacillus sp. J53TS2]GIP47413.1 hypothetical protein J53TS2_10040 [Paenibacillus sp. J53TS2]